MKKLIGLSLIAAFLVPFAASAATSRGELYRDRQDIREERGEYRDAQRYGNWRDVREERVEYRDARREYHQDLRDWRQDRHRGNDRGYYRGHRSNHFGYGAYRQGGYSQSYYYRPRHSINHSGRYCGNHSYRSHRWGH